MTAVEASRVDLEIKPSRPAQAVRAVVPGQVSLGVSLAHRAAALAAPVDRSALSNRIHGGGSDRRDHPAGRRDRRQDYRNDEGPVSKDKRDCKQRERRHRDMIFDPPRSIPVFPRMLCHVSALPGRRRRFRLHRGDVPNEETTP